MLIIVEGIDGVGKTTLVERLATFLRNYAGEKVDVWHAGPPKSKEALEEYELPLQKYRPGAGRTIICDRWHLGELIYGPLLRSHCLLSSARRYHLEKFLETKGALMVHLTASPDEIRSRRKDRDNEDDLLEDKDIEKVLNWYFDETFESMVHTIELIIEGELRDEHVTYIAGSAANHEVEALSTRDIPTYIGIPDPEILLLGERRNQNQDDRWDSAFVPLPGSSGEYLLHNLTEDVRMLCGIANAAEVTNLHHTWETLGFPSVVTLGTVADKICREVGISHGSVPHPQWVRRFAYHHGQTYGHLIRRAAKFQEELLSWRP
jgi:thymidylate kinase